MLFLFKNKYENNNLCYRQINEKASLCDNKEWESNDLHERVKSLNQEISNYK